MAQGKVVFTVVSVRRAGDPLPQPLAEGAARLTLVTAEGDGGRLGGLTPEHGALRRRRGEEGVRPPDRPARRRSPSPRWSWPGTPRPSRCWPCTWPCSSALTLGVVLARQRWSGVSVWVVAAPVALALAWATTDVVMRLLPNLI